MHAELPYALAHVILNGDPTEPTVKLKERPTLDELFKTAAHVLETPEGPGPEVAGKRTKVPSPHSMQ